MMVSITSQKDTQIDPPGKPMIRSIVILLISLVIKRPFQQRYQCIADRFPSFRQKTSCYQNFSILFFNNEICRNHQRISWVPNSLPADNLTYARRCHMKIIDIKLQSVLCFYGKVYLIPLSATFFCSLLYHKLSKVIIDANSLPCEYLEIVPEHTIF
ncbi:hypothetical protein RF11_11789 [Thelohanellus kitauei]|uniref:Uncharacterized protein n=1 Tax=Thelohanellus kitauei TaxID=669202 RepID=A0A0C2JCD9_THEKT|nr:hypothetical protein RF11_11789 [Thelohanellus kitauei]